MTIFSFSYLAGLMVPTALASGLVMAGISPPAPGVAPTPQCQVHRTGTGDIGPVTLRVRSGVLCPLPVLRSSVWSGAMELASPPHGGVVLTGGRSDLIYRSNRGFKGTDAFEIRTRNPDASSGATSTTHVSVLVD
jgi:hypothetical protein